MLKRLIYLLLPLLLLPLLGFGAGGDMERYFALPQPVEEYRQLYSLIESEQAEGFELAAPRGGERRQAIQMGDLDGDGTAEAMVFLRSTVNDTVETLFFHLDRGGYRQVLRLRGAGSSVEAVDLYDLDGDGTDELVIGPMEEDDFYRGMILELYTLDEQGAPRRVLQSTERDRWYNVSLPVAHNDASSSAAESASNNYLYDGGEMTLLGEGEGGQRPMLLCPLLP